MKGRSRNVSTEKSLLPQIIGIVAILGPWPVLVATLIFRFDPQRHPHAAYALRIIKWLLLPLMAACGYGLLQTVKGDRSSTSALVLIFAPALTVVVAGLLFGALCLVRKLKS